MIQGIAVNPVDKTLYVASFLDNRIVQYTLDGKYLGTLVNSSRGLQGPEGIAFLPSGDCIITSHFDNRVLRYDRSGSLSLLAVVDKPVGITALDESNLFVTSYTSNSVLRLDQRTGELRGEFVAVSK